MNNLDTRILAGLMVRRVECLAQILRTGPAAVGADRRRRFDAAVASALAKQRLLDALQNIERALDPFRDQPPEDRHWASPAARATCAAQAAQCERLLGEIIQQERLSETQLTQHRDEAADRLTAVNLASEAHGAYTAPDENWGQLDLYSET